MPLLHRALLPASFLLVACGSPTTPPDAAIDAGIDAGIDAAIDTAIDTAPEAAMDTAPEAAIDAAPPDVGPDAPPADVAIDAGPRCDAAAGLVACGARCVDLRADPAHCGACGRACAGAARCVAGACERVCVFDAATVAAGALNPDNPCERCDPAASTTAWTRRADGDDCGGGQLCAAGMCGTRCVIDGASYAPTAQNPANPCQVCNPGSNPRAWSPRADGASCGAGQVCSGATCRSGCYIDGAFHAAGAADPANACRACAPATSATAWTPRADGAACGPGRVCSGATCRSGCFVAGAFRPDGALDPANDCRACLPATSTTGYSTRADGSACGAAQFCTAGACGPRWHGTMPAGLTPVYGGSAAATASGRVVLFGGVTAAGTVSPITQVYNPATNTVSRGPDAPYSPYRSCAVAAPSGLIYVMGGSPMGFPLASVLTYDPAANRFASGPAMPFAADEHACALGRDGRIYVFATPAAARPGDLYTLSRTMILNPATGAWTAGAPMPTPRQRATAVTLADGRIAVTGGNRGYIFGELSTLNEVYSPATNTWSAGAPMPARLHWNVGALRSDGRVVLAGGVNAATGAVDRATYVYDPVANAWATGTSVTGDHYAGYAARTPDGRIYVLTGRGLGSVMSDVVDALY